MATCTANAIKFVDSAKIRFGCKITHGMAIKASSFLFGNILSKDFAHSFATGANQYSVGLSMFVVRFPDGVFRH